MFKKSRNLLMAAILDFFKNGAILILFFAKTLITLVLICSTMLFSALLCSTLLYSALLCSTESLLSYWPCLWTLKCSET
jgi:hypothetical protein